MLDNAARLGVLAHAESEILRSAARLYHDLTQILRLCVIGKFNPETAGEDLLRVMARAGDTPDFSALEARVRETQAEVRRVFGGLWVGSRDSWIGERNTHAGIDQHGFPAAQILVQQA